MQLNEIDIVKPKEIKKVCSCLFPKKTSTQDCNNTMYCDSSVHRHRQSPLCINLAGNESNRYQSYAY